VIFRSQGPVGCREIHCYFEVIYCEYLSLSPVLWGQHGEKVSSCPCRKTNPRGVPRSQPLYRRAVTSILLNTSVFCLDLLAFLISRPTVSSNVLC
jgi:hypothetical protein